MGNFLADIKQGEIAEQIVLNVLKKEFPKKKFKKFDVQKTDFDIVEDTKSKNKLTIEVKFDKKAFETQNLCFEVGRHPGEKCDRKPTGISISKADYIWYVVPTDAPNVFKIFKFKCKELLQYLIYNLATKSPNLKIVNGGDNWKFILLIIPIRDILEKQIGETISWAEPQD